jgi:trehalose-phosphatase
MSPTSTETPLPLPVGLPAQLAAEHAMDLFLDYDGTLSEITADLANAHPVPGVLELLTRLAARRDRFRVAVLSGRHIDVLMRLLKAPCDITIVGNHGLEIADPGGKRRMLTNPALFMPPLDAVRSWLHANVPSGAGFVVEDKRFSVALHYRSAQPDRARDLAARMREYVATQAPLVIGEGKMVIEAMPRQANKGEAVQILTRDSGERRLAVYFGDDVTDEDAFYVLREAGITVKVGNGHTASWARFRVASPTDVAAALAEMAAAIPVAGLAHEARARSGIPR